MRLSAPSNRKRYRDHYTLADTLLADAVDAALGAYRDGDNDYLAWLVARYLGQLQHIYQDEVFHHWNDISQEHTGHVCKTVRNWVLFPFYWSGVKADFRDLFPAGWRVADAREATDNVIASFEKAVRAAAKEQGLDGDAVLNHLRTWGGVRH